MWARQLSVLALLSLLLYSGDAQQQLVSSLCLGCICEASTACNTTLGCVNGYCGPFLISTAFYTDSGLSQDGSFAAFTYETCTADPFCSAAAIRAYMAKYPRDCDGDGRNTCVDYALVHKTGPNLCVDNQAALNSEYWRRFQACLSYFPDA